jgi:hypothetical protein
VLINLAFHKVIASFITRLPIVKSLVLQMYHTLYNIPNEKKSGGSVNMVNSVCNHGYQEIVILSLIYATATSNLDINIGHHCPFPNVWQLEVIITSHLTWKERSWAPYRTRAEKSCKHGSKSGILHALLVTQQYNGKTNQWLCVLCIIWFCLFDCL